MAKANLFWKAPKSPRCCATAVIAPSTAVIALREDDIVATAAVVRFSSVPVADMSATLTSMRLKALSVGPTWNEPPVASVTTIFSVFKSPSVYAPVALDTLGPASVTCTPRRSKLATIWEPVATSLPSSRVAMRMVCVTVPLPKVISPSEPASANT